MDKKVFCQGSSELANVLEKIARSGVFIKGESSHWSDSWYFYGKSLIEKSDNCIGYCGNPHLFEDKGYRRVSPQEFIKVWMQAEPVSCLGCPALYDAIKDLTEEYNFFCIGQGNAQVCYSFFEEAPGKWVFKLSSGGRPRKPTDEFIEYWKQFLPKKKVDVPKKTYIGFEGGPDVHKEMLPMGLKYPSDGFKKNIVYYLDGNVLHQTEKDWEFAKERVKVMPFHQFVLEATIQLYLSSDEERDFQKLMAAYSAPIGVPIMDPNKLAQVVIKPCISESSEEKLSLSPKKSLKIVL